VWSTIGEFFNLQAGKFVSAEDIHTESPHFPYRCFGGNGIRGYVSSFNRRGDYPIIGRQGALCGNVNYASGEFYATEHAVVVESFGRTDPIWAKYLLVQLDLNQYATATAQPGLSVKTINEVAIPIPPIGEQHRISDAITRCFGIINDVRRFCEDLRVSVAQTKSRILNLAIHGKLVPQDPNDEPAIELLKRINPNFKPSDNLHYIGNLPNGWCFSTIGDIFQHNTGKALNSVNRKGEYLRYITTSNLYWGWFDLTETRTMPFTKSEKEKCRATKGDLLVCEGGDVGRSAIWSYDYDIMIQNHIHRLRPLAEISVQYFYYIFLLYKQKGLIGGKGIGIMGLSSRELDKIIVPVPPVKEQQRIVSKIEELFSLLEHFENCCG
jgi:type I restriction enzyme S subunit